MILYIENPTDSTKENVKQINKFSKVAEYKINIQNQLHFYTLITNYQKEKLIKQSH